MMFQKDYNLTQQNNRLSLVTKAFLAIFFIVLFEGALRKWLFVPSIPLMLLRDVIVIATVIYGLNRRKFKFRAWPEFILMSWTVLVLSWALLQFIFQIMPFPVIFIGIRAWILYLWFAVLFARVVSRSELIFILKVMLWTMVPMVFLAVIQHLSPVHAFINRQAGGDDQYIFTVAKDIVRTTGTFSFTLGYTTYLALMTPLVLWLMSDGASLIKNYFIRLLFVGSFFLGIIVSGSRGAIFFTGGMLIMWSIISLLRGKYRKISPKTVFLMPILIVVVGYFLAPVIERAYEANTSRIESASRSEDVTSRIISIFIGSDEVWQEFDFFGKGIGAGSNAARSFMPATNNGFLLGENEIDRILNEGGILGLLFEFLKILVSIVGLILSVRILIKGKNFLPILFWVFLTVQLLTASTTGQITAHAFTFLSLAIGWALLKFRLHKSI